MWDEVFGCRNRSKWHSRDAGIPIIAAQTSTQMYQAILLCISNCQNDLLDYKRDSMTSLVVTKIFTYTFPPLRYIIIPQLTNI